MKRLKIGGLRKGDELYIWQLGSVLNTYNSSKFRYCAMHYSNRHNSKETSSILQLNDICHLNGE